MGANVEVWPHMQAWPWSWVSPGRSPCHHRWRPSSSGVSAEQESMMMSTYRISPNLGQMAELSVHLFTTSSQMHSTSGLSEQNLLQIEKRTLSLHSQLEKIFWCSRLLDGRRHVRNGGGK